MNKTKIKSLLIMLVILFFLVIDSPDITAQVTAGFYKKSADSLSLLYALDAKLMLVNSDTIGFNGLSNNWEFIYCSPAALKEYHFVSDNYHLIFQEELPLRVGIGVININWIDSDSALAIAESSGGKEFRNKYPSANIKAALVNYVTPPGDIFWSIMYHYNNTNLTILINAQTGSVITSIDKNKFLDYSLSQNFPNPFNPSTTINYSVPKTSFVTLKVYDILGREIAILVSEQKKAGYYKVNFIGKSLPSGIYIYKMQTGNFVDTKKLILLK